MSPRMIVLFNHTLTVSQREDGRRSLGAGEFLEPPAAVRICLMEIIVWAAVWLHDFASYLE